MAAAAPPKIRHEWYQTESQVVVSIFIRNVDANALTVDLEPRSASINVKLPSGSDVVWSAEPLARSIDPSSSSHRVSPAKIELTLKKREGGVKWTVLEGDDEDQQPVAQSSTTTTTPASTSGSNSSTAHSYPTSSSKKTNWDKFVAEAEKEDEQLSGHSTKDPNAGGDSAVNEMFQKLYANATDDQRRAMIKSYQESNGTSLSTDWDSVKKGKVETRPPDSMVARKWNE